MAKPNKANAADLLRRRLICVVGRLMIMHRIAFLLPVVVLISGCWVSLSPTTYRYSDTTALYMYRQQPPAGGCSGMTMEEVREAFRRSGSDLTLDDKEPNVFYFSAGKCPIWRYRFEKDRLVARGYLVMEMGIWDYPEIDYKKTHREYPSKFDVNGKKIGISIIRVDPKFDEHGVLIGELRTEEGVELIGK